MTVGSSSWASSNDLIAQRKRAFHAKTGREMTDDNVWLSQRLTDKRRWRRSSRSSPTRNWQSARARGSAAPARAPAPPTNPPTDLVPEVPRGNPDNPRAAAQRKHQATTERAEHALEGLIAGDEPITFRGLASGRRVDRLPLPLGAARPEREAPRRPAAHPPSRASLRQTHCQRRAMSCAP